MKGAPASSSLFILAAPAASSFVVPYMRSITRSSNSPKALAENFIGNPLFALYLTDMSRLSPSSTGLSARIASAMPEGEASWKRMCTIQSLSFTHSSRYFDGRF